MKDAVAANWVVETCTADAGGAFFTPTGTSRGYTSFSNAFSEGAEVFYSAHDANGNREAGVATFRNGRLEDRTPTATLRNNAYVDTNPQPITFDGEITIAGTFNAAAFNYIWDSINDITDSDGGIVITPEMVEGLIETLNNKADVTDLDAEIAARIAGDNSLQGQIDSINVDLDNYEGQHISDKLDQEIIDRADGDAALQGQINSVNTELANHNHDGVYQPVGDYIEDAPQDTKQYARQDGEWSVVTASSGGGGESLWSQNGSDIYYNAGNVGIGTDDPARQLTIQKDGTAIASLVNTAGGSCQVLFGDSDSDVAGRIIYDNNGDYMRFDTNGGQERVRIDASGNVRIGYNPNSAPFAKLDLFGSGAQNIYMTTTDSTATPNSIVSMYGSGGDYSDINFRAREFKFETGLALSPSNSPVVIDASGNVGIGTDSPAGGANTVIDAYGAYSSALNFHNATAGTSATDGGVVGQYGNDLVLFNYEAGIIQLGTSNTERMRIDANGNVGIGTDDPKANLHVAGASARMAVTDNANSGVRILQTTDVNYIQSASDVTSSGGALPLVFSDGQANNEWMRIDVLGRIGINNQSPFNKLDIKSSPASPLASTESQLSLRNGNGRATYVTFDNSANLTIYNTAAGDSSGGDTVFQQTSGEAMRITKNGNVGIGTDNPVHAVDIDGNLSLGGANPFIAFTPTAGSGVTPTYIQRYGSDMVFYNNGTGADGTMSWNVGTGGVKAMRIDADGSVSFAGSDGRPIEITTFDTVSAGAGWDFNASSSNGAISLSTAGEERMRIDASGRVGIGQSSPSTYTGAGAPGLVIGDHTGFEGITLASSTSGTGNLAFSDGASGSDQYRGLLRYDHAQDSMQFWTSSGRRVTIDASGNVGIGGIPGTRTAGEYLEQAKTRLEGWKATFDDRLKAEPEASTQEITLEVTDGDFGVFPTAEALAERMSERAIGGGNAKLQVSGDGYFSGDLNVGGGSKKVHCLSAYRANGGGVYFTTGEVLPADGDGDPVSGSVNLGSNTNKFKDGHFSGTIYGTVADVPSHVKAITQTQIANWDAGTSGDGDGPSIDPRISDTQITHWDTAYGWGNHGTEGYLRENNGGFGSTYAIPILASGEVYTGGSVTITGSTGQITTPAHGNSSQWNTAYGWGNHASAGYQPAGSYAASNHNHSGVYAPAGHTHSYVPLSGNSTISGTLTATDFVASSDERLKQNTVTAPTGVVDQLRGVEFEWREDGRQSAGVIAQEVEKVLPHLVHDSGEHKAVNYNGLVAYLIEEIKDLKKQIEELK